MGLFTFNFSPFQKSGPAIDEDFKTWINKALKRLADALAQSVVGSGLISSATAPLAYNSTTGVLSLTGGVGMTGAASHRATDINTTANAFTTAGLTVAVNSGDSWTVRWCLWVATGAGVSTGINFKIAAPTNGAARATVFAQLATMTSFEAVNVNGTTALTLTGPFCTADYSATDAYVVVEATFDAFTASGTVDLQFESAGIASQNVIIRRDSSVVAFKS